MCECGGREGVTWEEHQYEVSATENENIYTDHKLYRQSTKLINMHMLDSEIYNQD